LATVQRGPYWGEKIQSLKGSNFIKHFLELRGKSAGNESLGESLELEKLIGRGRDSKSLGVERLKFSGLGGWPLMTLWGWMRGYSANRDREKGEFRKKKSRVSCLLQDMLREKASKAVGKRGVAGGEIPGELPLADILVGGGSGQEETLVLKLREGKLKEKGKDGGKGEPNVWSDVLLSGGGGAKKSSAWGREDG